MVFEFSVLSNCAPLGKPGIHSLASIALSYGGRSDAAEFLYEGFDFGMGNWLELSIF